MGDEDGRLAPALRRGGHKPWREGVRVDPARAAHEAGLDIGDVGSEHYHRALGGLLEEAALVGDEHTAFDIGAQHPHGYALYFFTRRALQLLEE